MNQKIWLFSCVFSHLVTCCGRACEILSASLFCTTNYASYKYNKRRTTHTYSRSLLTPAPPSEKTVAATPSNASRWIPSIENGTISWPAKKTLLDLFYPFVLKFTCYYSPMTRMTSSVSIWQRLYFHTVQSGNSHFLHVHFQATITFRKLDWILNCV